MNDVIYPSMTYIAHAPRFSPPVEDIIIIREFECIIIIHAIVWPGTGKNLNMEFACTAFMQSTVHEWTIWLGHAKWVKILAGHKEFVTRYFTKSNLFSRFIKYTIKVKIYIFCPTKNGCAVYNGKICQLLRFTAIPYDTTGEVVTINHWTKLRHSSLTVSRKYIRKIHLSGAVGFAIK